MGVEKGAELALAIDWLQRQRVTPSRAARLPSSPAPLGFVLCHRRAIPFAVAVRVPEFLVPINICGVNYQANHLASFLHQSGRRWRTTPRSRHRTRENACGHSRRASRGRSATAHGSAPTPQSPTAPNRRAVTWTARRRTPENSLPEAPTCQSRDRKSKPAQTISQRSRGR